MIPPKPQVVPIGEGFTKSANATFIPKVAAFLAEANPPEPPPFNLRIVNKYRSRSSHIDIPSPFSRNIISSSLNY
jgi:hypothetical protein